MSKRSIRILVIDDEKIIRDFFVRLLSIMGGFEIFQAEDGYKAIDMIKKEKYDLFFLDVRMPGINGLDTFRQIRAIDPQAVVVMITGYAVEDLLQQAKDEGAYGAIRKPFDINEIKDVIAKIEAEKPAGEARVLVVDDEESIQHFFGLYLRERNIKCTQARNKQEALSAIAGEKFDLIFLDLVINNESGSDIYNEVKKLEPEPPVVLITGFPQKAEEIKEDSGIAGCLYKPFDMEAIARYIKIAQEKIS